MTHIHHGSILEVKADAIVNPANSFLQHNVGLAQVIDECARGSSRNAFIREDWPDPMPRDMWDNEYIPAIEAYRTFRAGAGLVATGSAVLGTPGALCRRYKAIIHAVGPIWGGGLYFERNLLLSAIDKALYLAEAAGFESIVFPAISAGIFGVPIEVVAQAMLDMCTRTELQVTIALTDPSHVEAFEKRLTCR